MAIWTVNFILVDLVGTLAERNFDVIHTLDWVKLTSRDNLLKTRGYYLQHYKETLLIAKRRDIRAEDISYSPQDILSPDFIQEQEVFADTAERHVSFGILV